MFDGGKFEIYSSDSDSDILEGNVIFTRIDQLQYNLNEEKPKKKAIISDHEKSHITSHYQQKNSKYDNNKNYNTKFSYYGCDSQNKKKKYTNSGKISYKNKSGYDEKYHNTNIRSDKFHTVKRDFVELRDIEKAEEVVAQADKNYQNKVENIKFFMDSERNNYLEKFNFVKEKEINDKNKYYNHRNNYDYNHYKYSQNYRENSQINSQPNSYSNNESFQKRNLNKFDLLSQSNTHENLSNEINIYEFVKKLDINAKGYRPKRFECEKENSK
jgi:hypothetical protein